jgi:tetratricopeptide (TPR) repeat protein
MHNLMNVLYKQGRQTEANLWHAHLEKLQPYPPFYFFNLGRLAMDKGDFSKAKTMFTKELNRDPYYHEFHFWLALAYFQLGEVKLADEQLGFARDNSTTQNSFELYSAKLDKIKSYASH